MDCNQQRELLNEVFKDLPGVNSDTQDVTDGALVQNNDSPDVNFNTEDVTEHTFVPNVDSNELDTTETATTDGFDFVSFVWYNLNGAILLYLFVCIDTGRVTTIFQYSSIDFELINMFDPLHCVFLILISYRLGIIINQH